MSDVGAKRTKQSTKSVVGSVKSGNQMSYKPGGHGIHRPLEKESKVEKKKGAY